MRLSRSSKLAGLVLVLGSAMTWAQGAPPPQPPNPANPPPPPPVQQGRGVPQRLGPDQQGRLGMPPQPGRPPVERAMPRWWNNPDMVQKLGINSDQIKKMDDIFQAHRLKLIDLNANLQKAEFTLEPLISADQPDEAKIVAQIDRVAQARAELEKANARMLLGIRQVLTPEQWKKLQEEQPGPGRGSPGRGPKWQPAPAGR
jgi:Spy/CpxP family protein refolding chaperone